ncbi:MAG: DUF2237 domain-containing protein [Sandaracinaceae bacterium]|nr:DUF2237 domain-containing protein [Sandaracinaceae bacterium]
MDRVEPVKEPSYNVLGTPIRPCSLQPKTGWFRDGCCNTDARDHGSHTICCRVTDDFLQFLRSQGNDLITPAPQHGFPGLRAGDQWCVCAGSWKQAYDEGRACPVVLESTHKKALEIASLDELLEHAIASEA